MKRPPLRSFRAENFKAIRDSGNIEFGWLTVFIGNNGAGKSSLIEALETFRDVVLDGVDPAFHRWRGFEHVLNKARSRKLLRRQGHREGYDLPLKFRFDWSSGGKRLIGQQTITQGPGGNEVFIEQEQLIQRQAARVEHWTRSDRGVAHSQGERPGQKSADHPRTPRLSDGQSMLKQFAWESFEPWQFLMLNPERMGQPVPQQRATSTAKLARDGANVAEYLNSIRSADISAFTGILEALQYVLPYATELQPVLTSELERAFYLKMKEGRPEAEFELPGWVLSTGTMRIVALLAALRHPNPPPLLVVEEIENGLDPRTIHLLVSEIQQAVESGRTQVVMTTHSPYLLDLLPLSSIVLADRVDGQPKFTRPADSKALRKWAESFSPGQLYTMNRLRMPEGTD